MERRRLENSTRTRDKEPGLHHNPLYIDPHNRIHAENHNKQPLTNHKNTDPVIHPPHTIDYRDDAQKKDAEQKTGPPITKHQNTSKPREHQAQHWFREAINQVNQSRQQHESQLKWTHGYNDAWTILETKR